MKFVVLGRDPAYLPLVRAIACSPQHALVAVSGAGELLDEIAAEAPQVRSLEDWRGLVVEPGVGAAIVGGFAPAVLEGARALASAGIRLLVFPDVRQSASFAYSLWPVADECPDRLTPMLRCGMDDNWEQFRERLWTLESGRPRFIQIERTCPPEADGLLSRVTVENQLLHDSALLRWLCGDYSRVTCLPTGLRDDRLAMMTVSLAGDGLPEATWRIASADAPPQGRLTIACDGAPLVRQLLCATPQAPSARPDTAAEQVQQQRWLRWLERWQSGDVERPQWPELVRAFDVVDAARRSVHKRRTVEVGSEEISELRQFKSLMTAAGCGVLVYTVFGVVAALLLGAIADPRDAAQRRSAAADFVVPATDFVAGSAELNEEGRNHVARIAPRLWETTADVIVEATATGPRAALDARRRDRVAELLEQQGGADAGDRVVARRLTGAWFESAMLAVWVLVFLPLGVLLLMQGLGLAARRGGSERAVAARPRTP